MNDLRRELAPIPAEAWASIEEEATRTLKTYLAARKVVDFQGPHGWTHSSVNEGRVTKLDGPAPGVEARRRVVRPLVELRVPFELDREELDAISRGSPTPEMGPVIDAARLIALAEDRAIFFGYPEGGIDGLLQGRTPVPLAGTVPTDLGFLSTAVERLREMGVSGPYALVVGPTLYTALSRLAGPYSHPILEIARRLIDGPVVWAPALTGAAVVSQRGGDFELVVGRDISIGYLDHDRSKVQLYLEESLTFRVLTPDAAVRIGD